MQDQTYVLPPLAYEQDPELYMFLQDMENDGHVTGRQLVPRQVVRRARPKYYAQQPGNKLHEIRNMRHLTQTQLAQMTGTTRRTISAIENGKNEPSVYLGLTLATALACQVEDIFYFESTDAVLPSKY